MEDNDERTKRRGKGRPPAPFKIERLAIATHLINQGWTFQAAAEEGVTFYRYDRASGKYVPDDDVNALMPQTKKRRRVALHQIRNELLAPKYLGDGPPVAHLHILPTPLAFRLETPLKRGRPKKNRAP
ncbi:hypothetical protein [Sphingobium agri]|uniref:Transposase n=1 Tax=Sphingobium agri TaxID=2933566 RepID=A0ABT0DYY8_9SPHN|nr:hypothetical protein [Sphingobium agri]MCK0532341.1 hypothetical protein [Sphingobium agri]